MDRASFPVNAGPNPAPAAPAPATRAVRRRAVLGLALAALIAAPACSLFEAPVIARGNRPLPEQISEISVGVHTRADVQAMIGSPTSTSAFGDQSWYYISARTRLRPMRHFGITDPETVAVDFDDRGVVRQVRVMGEADMQDVRMVSRETPSPGNERTFMQALFGNVGRVGGAGLGTDPSAGGAAGTGGSR
ncbi:MAG: outer membrane protein assembly factor BamE [Acetobacteraceae bacterium]|nr:outer membrane protein assembly factor BamE [Acetobacteraceae bacterium]